ncbi:MAG TPA: RNA methyltransferase [Longimicrobiaceae bacterium]|nr:RNA methyltransferase [Longimicrobiaceae bacterium]
MLERIVVVLWETQDVVNIAGTIRAMKNFGLSRLRLVSPVEWNEVRIEGIAHSTQDVAERTEIFDDLSDAIADCSLVVGMTARERRAKRTVSRPREIAPELLARAGEEGAGPIALLFGREDSGLSNAALDLCHRYVTIPTNPEHSSLNLAQAVLLMAYELWMATGEEQPFKPPRRDAPPATSQLLELLFADVERALWAVDFFKSGQSTTYMRTLRELAYRTDLDQREASFLRAIAIEVARQGSGEQP